MEKGKTGKNYSTAGVCPPPMPWPLSGQQNLIMCELNLENSNAPALPEWAHTHTHTHTHARDREVLLWEPWVKDQERLPRAALGLRSEGMNKWPDEKGVGWRGSERMFQTEQSHLPEPGGEWRKADLSHRGQAIVARAVEGAGAWPGCQDSEGTQSAQILFCHLSSKE